MLSKNVLVVDCHAVCHYVRHAFADLSYEYDKTGIIYGFFNVVSSAAAKLNAHVLVFAWDSRKSLRKGIYPEYKKKRSSEALTDDEVAALQTVWDQINYLREDIIPYIGFSNSFIIEGLEADDIIAYVVKNTDGFKYILSKDQDLYQLLSADTFMYDYKSRAVFGDWHFANKYDIKPSLWSEVKALAGCTTDGVEGVPGVGEKTAIKYLNGNLKSTYKAYKAIQENQDIIKRNRRLVTLPMEYNYESCELQVIDDFVDKERLRQVFERLGFESSLQRLDGFYRSFSGGRS